MFNGKKGNVYMVVMTALIIFMVGMTMINFIKPEVTPAYSSISCGSTPATDGTKVLCLVVDTALPYFILLVLSLVGGLVVDRFLI